MMCNHLNVLYLSLKKQGLIKSKSGLSVIDKLCFELAWFSSESSYVHETLSFVPFHLSFKIFGGLKSSSLKKISKIGLSEIP